MITSCPASAASPALTLSSRGLCVGGCLPVWVASRHMERSESCVAFLVLVKGFPFFTGLWKVPPPITAALKHRHSEIEHLPNLAEDGGHVLIHARKLGDG